MIPSIVVAAALAIPAFANAQAREVQPVTDDVLAIVGEKAQRSPENLVKLATFGLAVTECGAVLVDPGGSWKGAEALHAARRNYHRTHRNSVE
ncbi:MAG: hypothetical protein WCD16_14955 [Paracoccaceae bacterium]